MWASQTSPLKAKKLTTTSAVEQIVKASKDKCVLLTQGIYSNRLLAAKDANAPQCGCLRADTFRGVVVPGDLSHPMTLGNFHVAYTNVKGAGVADFFDGLEPEALENILQALEKLEGLDVKCVTSDSSSFLFYADILHHFCARPVLLSPMIMLPSLCSFFTPFDKVVYVTLRSADQSAALMRCCERLFPRFLALENNIEFLCLDPCKFSGMNFQDWTARAACEIRKQLYRGDRGAGMQELRPRGVVLGDGLGVLQTPVRLATDLPVWTWGTLAQSFLRMCDLGSAHAENEATNGPAMNAAHRLGHPYDSTPLTTGDSGSNANQQGEAMAFHVGTLVPKVALQKETIHALESSLQKSAKDTLFQDSAANAESPAVDSMQAPALCMPDKSTMSKSVRRQLGLPKQLKLRKPVLGVVRLDYNYPPAVGDIDSPLSYEYEVAYRVVPGLTFEMAQAGTLTPEVGRQLCEAVRYLVEEVEVGAITGDCGFMFNFQPLVRQLHTSRQVPIGLSSLCMLPILMATLRSDAVVMVVTASGSSLDGMKHLIARECGLHLDEERFLIVGAESVPGFEAVAAGEKVDVERVTPGMVALVKDVLRKNPKVAGILLECTQLPPYAAPIRKATQLPVIDSVTTANFMMEGCLPPDQHLDIMGDWILPGQKHKPYTFGDELSPELREKCKFYKPAPRVVSNSAPSASSSAGAKPAVAAAATTAPTSQSIDQMMELINHIQDPAKKREMMMALLSGSG